MTVAKAINILGAWDKVIRVQIQFHSTILHPGKDAVVLSSSLPEHVA
ncbi:MAG: hypothetical protein PQJ46_15140 [Spirochaetales bacterium]|nr:hypothetical protein [Spirochaetales bacterium]